MSYAMGWAGRRLTIVTAAILAWAASTASASPISATITYHTSGTIGTDRMTGGQVVGFQGIDNGTLTTPTPFQQGTFVFPIPEGYATRLPLGEFVVTPPAPLETTIYKDTPFSITFHVDSVDGNAPGAETKAVVLTGTLNGMVSGSGTSNLKASFPVLIDPGPPYFPKFPAGTFSTGGLGHVLTLPDYSIMLAPSTTRDGLTAINGELVSVETPVPEPSTVAVFLAASAVLACRRRFRLAK